MSSRASAKNCQRDGFVCAPHFLRMCRNGLTADCVEGHCGLIFDKRDSRAGRFRETAGAQLYCIGYFSGDFTRVSFRRPNYREKRNCSRHSRKSPFPGARQRRAILENDLRAAQPASLVAASNNVAFKMQGASIDHRPIKSSIVVAQNMAKLTHFQLTHPPSPTPRSILHHHSCVFHARRQTVLNFLAALAAAAALNAPGGLPEEPDGAAAAAAGGG